MIDKLAYFLGIVIKYIFNLFNDYGLSIFIFTFLSKIVLFPVNILVQKNSIKMLKIKPKLEELKYKYADDREKYMEGQVDLFDKEKYKPSLGIIPLLIQIPIILGLSRVITNIELYVNNVNPNMFGINLNKIPGIDDLVMPIIAMISTLLLCFIQNRANILQKAETFISKLTTTLITTILTVYFVFLVPNGVGLYWVFGNLLAIIQVYILNAIYPPKKYVDYEELKYWKEKNKEKQKEIKKNKKREKEDYKKFFNEKNIKKMKVVFFSEKNGFYKYFSGIIENLIKNSNIIIHYVTNDPNDSVFKLANERIKVYYIGKNKSISLFMKLEADIVIMTTPDLQKYYLKRSIVRKDIEYVYIDHGMTSINLTLREGAIDYFDTIFASTTDQKKELEVMKEKREMKLKNIVEVGSPILDDLIYQYESEGHTESHTILIAPSHQKDNILESCIDEMIEELLKTDYKIIVRPHPQFLQRNSVRMEELLNKYKDKFNDRFYFELDFSSNKTVYSADMVITDWSGIGIEYSFSTGKPTLYVNTKLKAINKNYEQIDFEPLDFKIRNKIGKAIEKEEVKNIKGIILELMNNKEKYKDEIFNVRNEYLYNLKNSGKVAADYIIRKIEK